MNHVKRSTCASDDDESNVAETASRRDEVVRPMANIPQRPRAKHPRCRPKRESQLLSVWHLDEGLCCNLADGGW